VSGNSGGRRRRELPGVRSGLAQALVRLCHGVVALTRSRQEIGYSMSDQRQRRVTDRGRYRVACQAMDLTAVDLFEGAGVLTAVKDKARCRALSRAGLRPSLTSVARAGLRSVRSGRRNDRSPIEQRNEDVARAHAGIARAGSNRWPVFSTPKQMTKSLRMAATTICLGLRRPALFRRATRAAMAGL